MSMTLQKDDLGQFILNHEEKKQVEKSKSREDFFKDLAYKGMKSQKAVELEKLKEMEEIA
jgi:hypothetical protein